MAKEQKSFPFASEATRQMGGHGLCFPSKKMAEATKNIVVNNISLQKSAPEHSQKVVGLENLREYQLEAPSGLLQGRDTYITANWMGQICCISVITIRL